MNRTKILFGDKHGVMTLTCDEHRPARSGGFIQKAVEPGPRLTGGEGVHALSFVPHGISYARATRFTRWAAILAIHSEGSHEPGKER